MTEQNYEQLKEKTKEQLEILKMAQEISKAIGHSGVNPFKQAAYINVTKLAK